MLPEIQYMWSTFVFTYRKKSTQNSKPLYKGHLHVFPSVSFIDRFDNNVRNTQHILLVRTDGIFCRFPVHKILFN